MKACDIMTHPVITARPDDSLETIAGLLLTHKIGCVPIVDSDGKVCGIVTESDFSAKEQGVPFSTLKLPSVFHRWMPNEQVEQVYQAARSTPAREIMTPDVVTLVEDDSIERVLTLMLSQSLRRLPVVRDRRPVGVVTRRDLLRLMANRLGSL
jgi:CBS domain-containing protein